MVLNFLAKMKYLLKYSNFVPYMISLSAQFVKRLSADFNEKDKNVVFLQHTVCQW